MSVSDLGPPHEAKNPNRMSPVGIVMFYVSENAETALRETAREAGTYAVAEFETMKEVVILDLTDLPRVPSLFEANERGTRQSLIFLGSFVREFSKPLASDANEHVEYVPSQIVTEYFRATFQMGRAPIAGIRYPSAQHRNYSSIVLFADERNFVDHPANVGHEFQRSEKAWLSLVGVKDRVHIDPAMVKKWSV